LAAAAAAASKFVFFVFFSSFFDAGGPFLSPGWAKGFFSPSGFGFKFSPPLLFSPLVADTLSGAKVSE
jgi:hypothetical protein